MVRFDSQGRRYLLLSIAVAATLASVVVAVHLLGPRPPLCLRAAEIFCEKLQSCGGLAEAQVSACVERHDAACELDLGWRLRRKILRLDREAEDECLEGLQAAGCGAATSVLGDDDQDILELTDRCELDELRPAAALGQPCALPGDCTDGTCAYAEPGCHVCKPFALPGQACSVGGDACQPGSAFCDRRMEGGRCATLKTIGATCQLAEECGSGVCRATAGSSRECVEDGPGPCGDSGDCSGQAFCRPAAGGGRCERRAATGAACAPNGSDSVCLDGEARCVRGRCSIRPFSEEEGAACLELTDCRSGLYCRAKDQAGGAGVCVRQSLAGEACRAADFGACVLSARCVDSRCKALAARGEACGGPYECLAELECIPKDNSAGFAGGAVCLAPAEPGEACGTYRSCRSGFCSRSGGGAVCIRKAPAGAACQSREECSSGRCQPVAPGAPSTCQGPCG